MAEIFTVETRGIGKPDYSKEISLGRERPGITLKYNQSLKNFALSPSPILSPYPWVTGVLAPGAPAHLVDGETYLAMPYTVPQGYTLAAISVAYSLSEDAMILVYADTFFFSYVGLPSGGNILYAAEIVGIGSHIIDPDGTSSHPFDLILVNQGTQDLEGTVGTFFILEAVGTSPLPTTKTVRCKFCGYEWVVPRETTAINCPKCNELNIYLDLSKFQGTP